MQEFRIEDSQHILVSRKVELGNLESLLQKTLFQLDQVSVIPGENGDFKLRMTYFTNNAHNIEILLRQM